jgi:hypothetical protein
LDVIDIIRRVETGARAVSGQSTARVCLVIAAAFALGACGQSSTPSPAQVASPEPAPIAFPSEPAGRLEIRYPLDETLFPPDIAAPTFVWNDETEGVAQWEVMLRFEGDGEPLRFTTAEPGWRPTEIDCSTIAATFSVAPASRAVRVHS